MNIYKSAEDYLECILVLKQKNAKVISLDVAIAMNYSKPSISRAMKNLRENGYLTIDSDGYIDLTEKGKRIAEKIYDRHVTLTNYFIKLGVAPEVAAEDACKIEHDISDETFNAIKDSMKK